MLLQLNIQNFALIEKLSITFDEGFNVLCGETGAGKSILVDAITYVLGGKFNKDFIRTGENKTVVEAIFTVENKKTLKVLEELDIKCDDLIIVSRESFASGRSISKVNGKALIVATLKKITQTLLDVHGQHENVALLDDYNHISYLDSYCINDLNSYMDEYKVNYIKYKDIERKILDITAVEKDGERLVNYLKYQIEEIDSVNLKLGEEDELNERFKLLNNADKIRTTIERSYSSIQVGNDRKEAIIDCLHDIIKDLKNISEYNKLVAEIVKNIEDSYYLLEQGVADLRSLKNNIYVDEDELAYVNSRIYDISKLKRKYGNTIEEIINYRDSIKTQYETLINKEQLLEELVCEKKKIYNVCLSIAEKIHNIRQEAGLILSENIMKELKYVGLEKTRFYIDVQKQETLNDIGFDKVSFLISTNIGEPLKSLDKVASGGELSRIMLALKTVFINKAGTPSIVFDEIDTGISGRIAQCVAEKMYEISNKVQIFCITHLPQIAAMSDNHYLIYKQTRDNKTYTSVQLLTRSEKLEELAKMIGGASITQATLNNAKEILQMTDNLKEKLKKDK